MANSAPNFLTLSGIVTADIAFSIDFAKTALIDPDGRILVSGTSLLGPGGQFLVASGGYNASVHSTDVLFM